MQIQGRARREGAQGLRETRGAALLLVLGILIILFAIALTFYTTSRFALRSATSYRNTVQTDGITAAGLSFAISTLQHDRIIHATYTSLDHAWRTYYNGTWAFGKPWLTPKGEYPNKYGYDAVPKIQFGTNGEGSGDSLYIPKWQDQAGGDFVDFLVATDLEDRVLTHPNIPSNLSGLLPAQEVDRWLRTTDGDGNPTTLGVDNDDDGLLDSMWIPVPMDQIMDNDGIDNDLDGLMDADDPGETAVFLYWGGNDGLDNDGDGNTDDDAEKRVFLTCPLDKLPVTIEWARVEAQTNTDENIQKLRAYAGFTDEDPPLQPQIASGPELDKLDNDHDFVVNESDNYTFDLGGGEVKDDATTWTIEHRTNAYTNVIYSGYLSDPNKAVTVSGEPVCEIVGRVAVLITDENSKVNLNASHAMVREEDAVVVPNRGDSSGETVTMAAPMVRAIDQGLGPQEYDTRVIKGWDPDKNGNDTGNASLGATVSAELRNLVMGSPDGSGLGINQPSGIPVPYVWDMTLPGYGGVDDNGNGLPLCMNGLDDDGDGLVDEGFYVPITDPTDPDYNTEPNPTYRALFGKTLEGIDEPQEFQRYRPYRNIVAERDNPDVLKDFFPNGSQIGELADRVLRTTQQMKLGITNAFGRADKTYDAVRRFVTVNSTDRNDRYWVRVTDPTTGAKNQKGSDGHPYPTGSGLKLDFNYAFADEIARALVEDWDYSAPVFPDDGVGDFALGLRQSGIHVVTAAGLPDSLPVLTGGEKVTFTDDRELRAYQIGANVQDARDTDFARTETTVAVDDPLAPLLLGPSASKQITYTQAGIENIRINEIMVRPVRRVEAEATPRINPDPVAVGDLAYPAVPAYPDNYQPDYALGLDPAAAGTGMPPFFLDRYYAIADPASGNFRPGKTNGLFYNDPITPFTQWTRTSSVLGVGSALQTDISSMSILEAQNGAPLANGDIPNIVEFTFRASQGLPAGRYYLLMNMWDSAGSYKDAQEDEIRYAVKYVLKSPATEPWSTNKTVGVTTILDDVIATIAPTSATTSPSGVNNISGDPNWQRPIFERVGSSLTPTGWAFLPTLGARMPSSAVGYTAGYRQDSAYTIEIPPATSGVELHVAVWAAGAVPDVNPIAINFFDFSQEPDHEWVEVQNVAKYDPSRPLDQQVVDMSGWKLQTRVRDLGSGDPKDIDMGVPDGTFIAPGGSLLLGFNKFDELPVDDSTLSLSNDLLRANGLGLAATRGALTTALAATLPGLANITSPPFPEDPSVMPGGFTEFSQLGDSVFARDMAEDFVDADGDGVADGANSPDALVRSTRVTGRDTQIVSALSLDPRRKPWDRIVELQCPSELQFTGSGTEPEILSQLAAMLFRGGMFPDYPESDGIDNDGDNYVLSDDGINNTGNNFLPDGTTNKVGDEADEGIDEGRWRYEHAGTADPFNPTNAVSVPGSYSAAAVVAQTAGATIALTDNTFPPAWKAFIERRFFPGDDVIITLKDNNDNVVDRVTYCQKDVENSAIDDKISGGGLVNWSLPNVWPDNTMGLDFYRTLERRHPLYTGDLYGTQNRWEATDGNYDDWAPNMGIGSDGASSWLSAYPAVFGHALQGSPLRANFEQRLIDDWSTYGSVVGAYVPSVPGDITWAPMLATARSRALASTADLMTMPQFEFSKTYALNGSPLSTTTLNGAILGQAFADTVLPPETSVANWQPDVAPGDYTALMNIASMDPQTLSAGQATFYPLYPTVQYTVNSDGTLRAGTYIGWNTNGFAPSAWAPLMLFGPVTPDVNTNPNAPLPADPALATSALWYGYDYALAPVYLMEPPQSVAFGDFDRWPLRQRAAMYVSTNQFPSFMAPASTGPRYNTPPPLNAVDDTHGAEALFVWDGASGLENGEYNVYVQVNTPLDELERAERVGASLDPPRPVLTGLGSEFRKRASGSQPKDVLVDVEFFTDRNGDGRCWFDVTNNALQAEQDRRPEQAELDRGDITNPITPVNPNDSTKAKWPGGDSFGELRGVQPNSEGLIHYGLVKVENNYLALMLRNWSAPGQIVRFSGVVLAPRKRTPGRININTAETRRASGLELNTDGTYVTGDNDRDFNPLLGIPGVLASTEWGSAAGLANTYGLAITFPSDSINLSPSDAPWRNDALAFSRDIMNRRANWEWNDGRYFRYPSDLVLDPTNKAASSGTQLPPNVTDPVLARAGVTGTDDEAKRQRFREAMARYSRMGNLLTTRSDTFEIIVTGQSGYVSRPDGDYRVDFEVMGEKRTRTVYER